MTAHSIDEERFAIALTERGWKLDSSYGWVKQSGAQRAQMERDWREALLAAVRCPYEAVPPEDRRKAEGLNHTFRREPGTHSRVRKDDKC